MPYYCDVAVSNPKVDLRLDVSHTKGIGLRLTMFPYTLVMANMDPKENGKIGIASMGFVFGLDILSGPVGVVTALLMKPGYYKKKHLLDISLKQSLLF